MTTEVSSGGRSNVRDSEDLALEGDPARNLATFVTTPLII